MSPPPVEKQTSTASITSNKKSKSAISSPKEKNNNNNNENSTNETNSNDNNQSQPEDKFKRFEGEGVVFKAKLVGTELVMEPRGDKMCQNSIQRLKAIIKGQKAHKRRIVMKISYLGVKIYDEKTNEILHHHEVPQISFIASDDTDTRTFGYVCDVPNKAHQFICFKTAGPAIQVMSVISGLFEAVLEKKNNENSATKSDEKESTRKDSQPTSEDATSNVETKDHDHNSASANKTNKLTKVDSLTGDLDGLEFVTTPAPLHFGVLEMTANNSEGKPTPAGGQTTGELTTSQSGVDLVSDQFGYLVLGGSTGANNYFDSAGSSNIHGSSGGPLAARAPLAASASMDSTYGSCNNTTTSSNTNYNNSSSLSHNDSTDKYAVFNDIENLPSIFESTSSLNSLGGGGGTSARHPQQQQQQPQPQPQPQHPQQQQAFQQPFQQQQMAAGYGGHVKPAAGPLFNLNRSNNSLSSAGGAFGGEARFSFGPQSQSRPYEQQPAGQQTARPAAGATLTSSASASAFTLSPPAHFQQPPPRAPPHFESGRQPAPTPTPSMMVPTSASQAAFRPLNHSSSSGLIVGSAPMSGHQLSQHARFSSSMVGALHQRLGSSAASVQSVGSAGALSRQTNPFDDDFFA